MRFSEGNRVQTFEGDTGVVILVRGSGDYAHNYDYNVRLDTGETLNYWDDELSISLVKDPVKINDAARRRVCAQALLAMGPQVELNFSPNRWAGNGAPLIAFPQGSVLEDEGPECGWLAEPGSVRSGCKQPTGHFGDHEGSQA